MNELYPIIRRARRPLTMTDGPTVEDCEPLKPEHPAPVAIVPLVESVTDSPPAKQIKSHAGKTKN